MVALMAVIAHATAQDLDEKYATDLLKAGTEAPDMRVGTGKDGKAVRLSDLKGKYVLINFWASWCPDCRRETPALQRLWQKYGEKGLQIAGISYDTNREAWQKYIADNKMVWWQYSELKKWKKETESDRLYHINWIPTLYLIAPDGPTTARRRRSDTATARKASASKTKQRGQPSPTGSEPAGVMVALKGLCQKRSTAYSRPATVAASACS